MAMVKGLGIRLRWVIFSLSDMLLRYIHKLEEG